MWAICELTPKAYPTRDFSMPMRGGAVARGQVYLQSSRAPTIAAIALMMAFYWSKCGNAHRSERVTRNDYDLVVELRASAAGGLWMHFWLIGTAQWRLTEGIVSHGCQVRVEHSVAVTT